MGNATLLTTTNVSALNLPARTISSIAATTLSLVGSGTTQATATTLGLVGDLVARIAAVSVAIVYQAARLSDASGNSADPTVVAAAAATAASLALVPLSDWSVMLAALVRTGN